MAWYNIRYNIKEVVYVMKQKPILLIRNVAHFEYGGAEKYQLELAKLLKKNNLTPIILSSSKRLIQNARLENIQSHKSLWWSRQNWSGHRNALLPLYFLWQIVLALQYFYLISKFHPKILQIQNRDDMLAGTIIGRLTGTNVIWVDHADLRETWQNVHAKFKNPIGKLILKLSKHVYKIITVSQFEYDYLKKSLKNNLPKQLIVIKNGVIDQKYQFASKTKKTATTNLCFIGRPTQQKGIQELLDAFEQLSKEYRGLKLNICGSSPEEVYWKRYVNNSQIIFHGYLENRLDILSKSDIFLLPTYKEGLSLSLIEACMMQKTIIATDVDGNPEIIKNEKTGLLIPPRNKQALISAVKKLLKNPDLCQSLAKAARKTYKQDFDLEVIVRTQIIPLYDKIES